MLGLLLNHRESEMAAAAELGQLKIDDFSHLEDKTFEIQTADGGVPLELVVSTAKRDNRAGRHHRSQERSDYAPRRRGVHAAVYCSSGLLRPADNLSDHTSEAWRARNLPGAGRAPAPRARLQRGIHVKRQSVCKRKAARPGPEWTSIRASKAPRNKEGRF